MGAMPVSEGWRMKNEEISRLIWAGKYAGKDGAVAQHRKLYEADPKGQLIPFAVTLYSARKAMRVTQEFPQIAQELRRRLHEQFETLSPDALDVISTHQLWWSKQRSWDRGSAAAAALSAAQQGLRLTSGEVRGGHTRPLLALTSVEASILTGDRKSAKTWLRFAASHAPKVKDPNQQVRVYRKLAYIYLRYYWNPFQAWKYYQRARSVNDVSPDAMNKTKILGV